MFQHCQKGLNKKKFKKTFQKYFYTMKVSFTTLYVFIIVFSIQTNMLKNLDLYFLFFRQNLLSISVTSAKEKVTNKSVQRKYSSCKRYSFRHVNLCS